jgi:hypothetical protein
VRLIASLTFKQSAEGVHTIFTANRYPSTRLRIETSNTLDDRRKKMKTTKAGLLVLALGLVIGTGFFAGTAYAQGGGPPAADPTIPGRPFLGRGPVGGMLPADGEHPLHDYLVASFSEAFGMSESDLESRLESGESMMDIALSTGLSQDEAREAIMDAHQAAIDVAQADGVELPVGTGGGVLRGTQDGDCLMDGSGPAARGRMGMRGFGGVSKSQ